jgi:hypothetical protein
MVRGLLSFRPLEAARRDHRLDELEERVLSAFLADQILGERAVDIAALGSGVVELTGTVNTDEEAAYAVRTALALPGVLTVVNRLATLDTGQAVGADLRGDEIPGEVAVHAIPEGRVVGMGRRRQGTQTDPDQPDDSGKLREKALDAADRDSWEDEGFLASSGQFGRDTIEPTPVNFDESELDNQDPGHKW